MTTMKACSYRQGKKRKMKKFRIDELAAVDRPAQEGARAVLMKRADEVTKQRCCVLTSEVDGHAHAIMFWSEDSTPAGGETTEAVTSDEVEHEHAWIMNPDGSVTIAASAGHSHEVAAEDMLRSMVSLGKREFSAQQRERLASSGAAMPDGSFPIANASDLRNAMRAIGRAKDPAKAKAHIRRRAKALGMTEMLSDAFKSEEGLAPSSDLLDNQHVDKETAMDEKELQALKAKLARAEAMAELTDAEKSYLKTLGEKDAEKFLASNAAERAAQLTKAAEANPVVYKATDGTEFRKNDDVRLVEMAKRADATEAALKSEREARDSDRITKRAETELPHYPGELAAKVALVKAVEGIADAEQRKQAEAALKAGEQALAGAFVSKGTTAGTVGGAADATTAEAKLDTLAKSYATEHKVSEAVAYNKVLETAEGKALYAEYTSARGVAN